MPSMGLAHASNLDPELTTACRYITGCVRAAPTHEVYLLARVARRSFLHSVKPLESDEDVEIVQLQPWEESLQKEDNTLSQPSFSLAAGFCEMWLRWRCLNRLRAQLDAVKQESQTQFTWGPLEAESR